MPIGRRRPNKTLLMGLVGLGAVVIALIVMLAMPKQGTLRISVAGPGGREAGAVQIYIDGRKTDCETSPCVVKDLPAGDCIVKVTAAGFPTPPPATAAVVGGEETTVTFDLGKGSGGTGIKVSAAASGLKLWVDGKEIGPLPQEVKDLSPGEHRIRVAGNDRLAPYEETISVAAGELRSVGPVMPKVLLGLAKIVAGRNASDARVMLVSGSDRRLIPSLPFEVDVKTDKTYKLVATRKGFRNYEAPVEFDAGIPEKTFTVALSLEEPEEVAVADNAPPTPRGRVGGSVGRSNPPATNPPPSTGGGGKGKLNINSVPASNVLLDGRPLGSTPKMGVSVSAGTHTVMFVHPKMGRKSVTVRVTAGKTAAATTKFP